MIRYERNEDTGEWHVVIDVWVYLEDKDTLDRFEEEYVARLRREFDEKERLRRSLAPGTVADKERLRDLAVRTGNPGLDGLDSEELWLVRLHHPSERVRRDARLRIEGDVEAEAKVARQEKRESMRAEWLAGPSRAMTELTDVELQVIVSWHPSSDTRNQARSILMARAESGTDSARSGGVLEAQELSFELLPPGTWAVDDVIRYYREVSERLPANFSGRSIQWERIKEIQSLGPVSCYQGREGWLGYTVYTFANTERVVLECPIEGNAVYVLHGDWKQMARFTKRELRERFPDNYVKVVHKGEWLLRVKEVLKR